MRARLEGGRVVEAHLGDRGRLLGIVVPGNEVYLVHAPAPTRRTAYSLLLARCPPLSPGLQGPLTCLEPAGANRLVHELLLRGVELPLPRARAVRREVTVGRSRFDLLLETARGDVLVEVKSCAAAAGEAALFPDAPSDRARRHCEELAAHVVRGGRAAIVLVAQRGDVREIRPHPVDPPFAVALAAARRAGVRVVGLRFEVTPEGFVYRGELPVRVRAPRR